MRKKVGSFSELHVADTVCADGFGDCAVRVLEKGRGLLTRPGLAEEVQNLLDRRAAKGTAPITDTATRPWTNP